MFDYIVVGAGLYGSVFAQQAREHGKLVKVIERRGHIGGNCFSSPYEDTKIIAHRYGTHIFHCNSHAIWNYVNRFTGFNRYRHRVLTTHEGRVFAMPINLGTVNQFYGLNLKPSEVEEFIASKREDIEKPANLEEKAISLIGVDLYEAFIKGYTIKQWGRDPKELPASIINRLPVRHSFDDSYFSDYYQGIPLDGFTPIFERMLEGVPIDRNVDFFEDPEYWRRQCKTLVYTGPIDQFFEYRFGKLSWRSVRFEWERVDCDDFQGTSVMNYADQEVPWTRIHEFKHLHPERASLPGASVIVREFSKLGEEDPYYPVNSDADRDLLRRYQELADKEANVIFGGRLAEYKYYDMHHAIGSSLKKAQQALSANHLFSHSVRGTGSGKKSHYCNLIVVMPVYNEEACISQVVDKWLEILSRHITSFKIIVINDGSRDNTAETLKAYDDNPNVEVIHKSNSGHGPTILEGYKRAVGEADWVFQCDSDDEMPPDHFPLLWEKRHDYDALFGCRTARHQGLGRKLITLTSRAAIRLLFGSGVRDVNTPYRLMRSWYLKAVVESIPPDTFAPNILISGVLNRSGLRILNYPVLHENRRTGSVSIVKWKLIKAAARSLRQTIRYGYSIRLELNKD